MRHNKMAFYLLITLYTFTIPTVSYATQAEHTLFELIISDMQPTTLCEKEILKAVLGNRHAKCSFYAQKDTSSAQKNQNIARSEFVLLAIKANQLHPLNIINSFIIDGADIRGVVYLNNQNFDTSIAFNNCLIRDGINFNLSKFQNLSFTGSHCKYLHGQFATIHGLLALNENFTSDENIDLTGSSFTNIMGDNSSFNSTLGEAISASNIQTTGFFSLNKSRIEGNINISKSTIGSFLSICDSSIKNKNNIALDAKNVKVSQNLLIKNTHITGEIDLLDASIGNLLSLEATILDGNNGTAINAQRIKSESGIFLRNKFSSIGLVDFSGSTTNGDFDCTNGTFNNHKKVALDINNFKSKNIHFSNGFSSHGLVTAINSEVDGNVTLDGGKFENSPENYSNISINLSLTKIHGDITFNEIKINKKSIYFKSKGMVRLIDTKIDGSLISEGGQFNNTNGRSIDAERISVHGSIFLRKNFHSLGEVNFTNATIDNDFESENSKFQNIKKIALNCTCMRSNRVFLTKSFYSEGLVNFTNSKVTSLFDCRGGIFINDETALDCSSAIFGGNVDLSSIDNLPFTTYGSLNLTGAQINGSLFLSGAIIINTRKVAVLGDRLHVKGSAHLRNGLSVIGIVQMRNLTTEDDLDLSGGTFHNIDGNTLDLQGIKAKRVFMKNGFISNGKVVMRGALINGPLECQGGQFLAHEGAIALDVSNSIINQYIEFTPWKQESNTDIIFKATGEVNFYNTECKGQLNISKGQIINDNNISLNAQNSRFKGIILADDFYTTGTVDLSNAHIDGNLNCHTGKFDRQNLNSENIDSLTLTGASIEGDVIMTGDMQGENDDIYNPFRALSKVNISNTIIKSDLNLIAGQFLSKGCALHARATTIDGDVLFNRFQAEGCVDFSNATIKKIFQYKKINRPNSVRLILSQTKIGTYIDDVRSRPEEGNLHIDGMTYSKILSPLGDIDSNQEDRYISTLTGKTNLTNLIRTQYTEKTNKCQDNRDSLQKKFSTQPYEQLEKYYKETGAEFEAKNVVIAKYYDMLQLKTLSLSDKFFAIFSLILGGYIYYFWITLLWSFILIIFGSVLFHCAYKADVLVPTHGKHKENINYHRFNSFIYSLETFFPIFNLYHSNNWRLNSKKRAIRFLKFDIIIDGKFVITYLWVHIMSGWLFAGIIAIGIASYIKK